ncbi:hypothetical protein CHS0354_000441 [Potamilus streckersoni]|uniref:tRNA/rRNA methyltransferase SpoU type domain-containing protein n=1 Tax=Potamilus streckersoni TaxID=2493646 RepID=A0AAE0W7B3_9BIVA|nr:hypothetical protein CHS0354_000441 [Potamilus streckersoni]
MLDQIQDPSNLGGIIRTAAWFGVKHIVSTKGTCDFFNPKSVSATAGSIFALPLIASMTDALDTVAYYESMGYDVFVTTLKASELGLNCFLNSQKILLILGNEGAGVSKQILDFISEQKHITVLGNCTSVESLNVVASVTALLALYCHRNVLKKLP